MDYPSQCEIINLNEVDFLKSFHNIDSKIYWKIDNGRCPFIKKKRNGPYYCEIHKIKPKVCRDYRCDLNYEDWITYLEQRESEFQEKR